MAQVLKTEQTLSIKDKSHHRPWAVLKYKSRAQDSSNTPRFVSSDHIEGTVELSLDSPIKIKHLSVTLLGFVTEGGFVSRELGTKIDADVTENPHRFFEKTELLIPDDKQPLISTSPSSESFNLFRHSKREGETAVTLTGDHSFPISIHLPPTITVKKGDFALQDRTYFLPPSFELQDLEISINYELRIRAVVSSTLGSTNYEDQTLLHVQDTRHPPPIPESFKKALEAQCPFLGPADDPKSWWISESVASTIHSNHGKAFQVTSKLAIPQPLCYTLRDTVPLRFSVKGHPEDLRLLSDGSAIRLCLVRNLSRDRKTLMSENRRVDSDEENYMTCVKCASVWPVESKDPGQIEFHMEVFLDQTLLPSFDFVTPSIAYHIMKLPYELPSLKKVAKNTPIVVQNIGVLPHRAAGTQPWKSFKPSTAIMPAIPNRQRWYDNGFLGTTEMMLASYGR